MSSTIKANRTGDPQFLKYYYLKILNLGFPKDLKKRKNVLISGAEIGKDSCDDVAYINAQRLSRVGKQQRDDLSRLLYTAMHGKNIVAKLDDKEGFTLIEDNNSLYAAIIGNGNVIMGAAGPNVKQYGYKVLHYILMQYIMMIKPNHQSR